MSDITDFLTSGLQTIEPSYPETFTYNGVIYHGGLFRNEIFQEQLIGGGFKNVRGSTLEIRQAILPTVPVIGTTLVYNNVTYRILGITTRLVTWLLTLADISK